MLNRASTEDCNLCPKGLAEWLTAIEEVEIEGSETAEHDAARTRRANHTCVSTGGALVVLLGGP